MQSLRPEDLRQAWGNDVNKKGVFNASTENKEILENRWAGRTWKIGNWVAHLGTIDEPYGLMLQLDHLNNSA